jgi:RNA polymerase sigma factor, sigma-70 family
LEEDRKDIEAVLAGNTEAFGNLIKRYQRPIYYLALRMLRQPEDADDVTQKTFLKAYRALAGFEFRSSFKTWLSAIAINLCRTELMRPRRLTVELPENLPNADFDNQAGREDHEFQRHYLKEALENLPQRQKEVVLLRIYQEMPFKEIAQALESNETAVKVNFHYAMQSLKKAIQKRIRRDTL